MTSPLLKTSPSRSGRRWRRLLSLAASVLILLLGVRLWAERSFDSGPLPSSLRDAHYIFVRLPNGRQTTLDRIIRPGLPTVISLWASWCGPCRLEAPHILALRRRFGPKKLNLVYLNVREDGASQSDLAYYLRSVDMKPQDYVVMDYKNLSRLTNDKQNLIPRTYIFDETGMPTAIIVGYKPLALARIPMLLTE